MGTMFSLKVAQDPKVQFRRKQIDEKSASCFLRRVFEKRYFLLFSFYSSSLSSPISQD